MNKRNSRKGTEKGEEEIIKEKLKPDAMLFQIQRAHSMPSTVDENGIFTGKFQNSEDGEDTTHFQKKENSSDIKGQTS